MKWPIEPATVMFMVARPPEVARDWETKQPRTDEDGRTLFTVVLVAMGPDSTEIVPVRVAGEPKGLDRGVSVRVHGLVASTWSMGDRNGVSFRADRLEPMPPTGPAPARAAS
jgi:hypothetical protein